MIQLIIVIGLFLIAALWMGRRLYNAIWGGEGKCDSCAISQSAKKIPDITTSSD